MVESGSVRVSFAKERMLMAPTPEDLVKNITQLNSFPDVAFQIDELLSDEESDARDIGKLIELDPALTAALFRTANSPAFGVSTTIDSVDRAITLLGHQEIRDLVFGISVSKAFEGISSELVTVEDFWKHSLYCALASQRLGRLAKLPNDISLFSAGLLHDIGQLVMFNQCPELSRTSLELSLDENDGLLPYLSERDIFGYDHMVVGAELARQWNLPSHLRLCIEFHHEPFAPDATSDAVRVVHLANSISVLAELDSTALGDASPIHESTYSNLGLTPEVVPEIISEIKESVVQLLQVFTD